jgi:hypothetical protein
MDTEKKLLIAAGVVLALLVGFGAWVECTHAGRAAWNLWFGSVQKVDDATNYETRKKVEDTCRAMVSSYEADKLTWQQYRDSDSEEKQSWAEQAKMRANKTAATYNNYILENSYVWSGNVPDDIKGELEYLE